MSNREDTGDSTQAAVRHLKRCAAWIRARRGKTPITNGNEAGFGFRTEELKEQQSVLLSAWQHARDRCPGAVREGVDRFCQHGFGPPHLRVAVPGRDEVHYAAVLVKAVLDVLRAAADWLAEEPPREPKVWQPLPPAGHGATSAEQEGKPPKFGFIRNGENWNVTYQGKSTSFRHSKGMTYLCELLRKPGHNIAACDLVGIEAGREEPSTGESRQKIMDDQAMNDARQRYRDLMPELERARGDNNTVAMAETR